MKYLLLLLLTFSVSARTVNGSLERLLFMWNPNAVCSVLPQIDENDVRSNYERLECTPDKPSFSVLQGLLADWEAELAAKEAARLAEIARVEALKSRFNAFLSSDITSPHHLIICMIIKCIIKNNK